MRTSVPGVALLCATALTLAACSYSWEFTYRVTVAPGIPLDPATPLRFAQVDGHASSQPGPIPGTALVEASRSTGGRRDHVAAGRTCCAPEELVALFAFLDLDDDGTWDPGEPWGADPGNPVTIREDGYVSTILVEADRPARRAP